MIKLNLRLILIFLEISVIPLFLISYLALYQTKKMITVGTLSQLEQIAAVNKSKINALLSENRQIIGDVSSRSEVIEAFSTTGARVKKPNVIDSGVSFLSGEKGKRSGVGDIDIVDFNGKVVLSSNRAKIGQETGLAVKETANRDPNEKITNDFVLDREKKLVLATNGRLVSEGEHLGFVTVERSGDSVISVFEDNLPFGNSVEFILVVKDGIGDTRYVTPSRFDQIGPLQRTTPGSDFSQSATIALSGQEKALEDSLDWRGKHVLAATRYIDETGWGLVAKKDRDETYLPLSKLSSLLAVIAVVAAVIIVLISLTAATSIVAPIKRLIKITGKISGGDLSQRTIVESKDEIGLLELAFNQMAEKLNESYENLERKVSERTSELEISRRNLEIANINLRELDRLKDEFVSVASHELRTPMTAIRGLISMIFEGDYGPVNKNLAEPLSDISRSTQRLIVLVNDILNVSRIETGRLKISLSQFDIWPVIDEMVEQLMPIAIEKGLTIETSRSETGLVQADKDKVREILNNLIGNALKFTESGGVTVSCKADHDQVKVFIEDTGIGISADNQVRLFGKFNQITTQQIGKPSGSGLGLYISRELARKMGGEIWIEKSDFAHGSTFAFSLPVAGTQMARLVVEKIRKENQSNLKRQEILAKIV